MSYAVREIIREAMDEAGYRTYSRLLRDAEVGRVAAKLLATWSERAQLEPMTETSYVNSREFVDDVAVAMERHGEQNFKAICALIGEKLVHAAMQYILSTHEPDGEDVEQEIYFDELRNEEMERRMWRRDRGL